MNQGKQEGAGINNFSAQDTRFCILSSISGSKHEQNNKSNQFQSSFYKNLCFDFAVLFSFTWTKAKDRNRILAGEGMYHRIFVFNFLRLTFLLLPASLCRWKFESYKEKRAFD